jgi:hypothetical protein
MATNSHNLDCSTQSAGEGLPMIDRTILHYQLIEKLGGRGIGTIFKSRVSKKEGQDA